jgi:DNA-binding FrmR family transcriptional regulator
MDTWGTAAGIRETTVEQDPQTPDTTTTHGASGHGHGYSGRKDEHLKRLRRVEGQIRGLQRMVSEDEYCIDILTQVSAATKALQSFALSLLEEHLAHCVANAVEKGGPEADEKVKEASQAIARLVRS